MDPKRPPEIAYFHLKEAILDLHYKPQAPLRTQAIASNLGLSRTPVREALNRLEQEGLVLRNEGCGYVVRSISIKEAMDIYEMRELLEVKAAREAARRISRNEINSLRAILKRAEMNLLQRRPKDCRDQNRAFNILIARAAGNACLEGMLSSLADRTRWLGSMITDRHTTRPQEALQAHRKILDALEAADSEAAAIATKALVVGARESFMEYVMSATAHNEISSAFRPALSAYVA